MKQFRDLEYLDACPLCGSDDIGSRFPPDVFRCHDCRIDFRNPRPGAGEIASAYDLGETYRGWEPEQDVRNFLWDKRIQLLRSYVDSGELLDIGSGDGHFLQQIPAEYHALGTEISARAVELAVARSVVLELGEVEDLFTQPEQFDAVTMWHSLEHLPRPGECLRHCYSILRPGGYLFIAVPNESHLLFRYRVSRILARKRPNGPYGLNRPGREVHLVHFRYAVLSRMLRNDGFQVVESGVDDVYTRRTLRYLVEYYGNLGLQQLTGRHLARAMYVVARKPATS